MCNTDSADYIRWYSQSDSATTTTEIYIDTSSDLLKEKIQAYVIVNKRMYIRKYLPRNDLKPKLWKKLTKRNLYYFGGNCCCAR